MWEYESDRRPAEGEWVKVAWAKDQLEGLMIQGRLEAEGIAARLSRNGAYGARSRGLQVLAREGDAERARTILEQVVSEDGQSLS